MSQTVGRTRGAYHRLWHHTSLASPTTPPLGRLASRIAVLLMGKHKPTFDPSTDCGDYVVATNCSEIHVTGKKMQQKKYYSHTTRPGSLKELSMEALMKKWGGGEILKRAVRGMLPKNRLRDVRMQRLKVFEGDEHPFAQNIVKVNSINSGPILTQLEEHLASLESSKINDDTAETHAQSVTTPSNTLNPLSS